jgi:hypothetical protein
MNSNQTKLLLTSLSDSTNPSLPIYSYNYDQLITYNSAEDEDEVNHIHLISRQNGKLLHSWDINEPEPKIGALLKDGTVVAFGEFSIYFLNPSTSLPFFSLEVDGRNPYDCFELDSGDLVVSCHTDNEDTLQFDEDGNTNQPAQLLYLQRNQSTWHQLCLQNLLFTNVPPCFLAQTSSNEVLFQIQTSDRVFVRYYYLHVLICNEAYSLDITKALDPQEVDPKPSCTTMPAKFWQNNTLLAVHHDHLLFSNNTKRKFTVLENPTLLPYSPFHFVVHGVLVGVVPISHDKLILCHLSSGVVRTLDISQLGLHLALPNGSNTSFDMLDEQGELWRYSLLFKSESLVSLCSYEIACKFELKQLEDFLPYELYENCLKAQSTNFVF